MKQQNKSLRQLPLFTLMILLLLCIHNNAPAQTVPQIAEKALDSIISLSVEIQDKNGKSFRRGSGFIVRDNLIATNYHVIERATQVTVKLMGKDMTYTIGGITATDPLNDLALMQIDDGTPLFGIKPLPLGDSDAVQIGERVYVVGNPLGLEGTVSEGIISARRDINTRELIQMTAPISPGSSGGPVLNHNGEVIGVSVSVHHNYPRSLSLSKCSILSSSFITT